MNKRHYVHLYCQNSVYSELIFALSCNFQILSKGEDQFTKTQYVHTATNATATATFTSYATTITIAPTTTSMATTCKVKSIKKRIARTI